MKVALLFDNFGPYHKARAEAAAKLVDLVAIEFGHSSATYDWAGFGEYGFEKHIINPNGASGELHGKIFRRRLETVLDNVRPDVVAIPGWGSRSALCALSWSQRKHLPAIVMSESTAWDHRRRWLMEKVKGKLLQGFSAALVGGRSHHQYLSSLGFADERIWMGYDAVDNDYFIRESEVWRVNEAGAVKRPYFLASNRFIERKNLRRLVEVFARLPENVAWDLCLLGDGELKTDLLKRCKELDLKVAERAPWEKVEHSEPSEMQNSKCKIVYFPGFRQLDQLPRFYAHAGCFVHPALTEPWGLVVNEAMACGLPVIVSSQCGCAADLVIDNCNGFTFDPTDEVKLQGLMTDVALSEDARTQYGKSGQSIVAHFGVDAFGIGLQSAAIGALQCGPASSSGFSQLVVESLVKRIG